MKRLFQLIVPVIVVILASCSGQKRIIYFQDLQAGQQDTLQDTMLIRLQISDKVNIHVSARDPEISNLFSLYSNRLNTGTTTVKSGYTIDSNGDITFPILGKLHVAGMTREELTEYIVDLLEERQLVKNPVVTVEFENLSVMVLGDASNSKRLMINKDYYTLLDAMSDMGDLQITGVRETVKVLRNNKGIITAYNVNLCSADSIYHSPVYYLQQNDVIYIAPNPKKTRGYYDNATMLITPTFWTGIVSSALSLTSVIIALTRTTPTTTTNSTGK